MTGARTAVRSRCAAPPGTQAHAAAVVSLRPAGSGGEPDVPGIVVPAPRQFPVLPQHLDGRASVLRSLGATLARHDGGSPLAVVVTGPDGAGKTALALRWLSRSCPTAEGCLHADFGSPAAETVQDVLGRWLRSLGVPGEWIPAGGPERIALWRSASAGKRLGILIDDVPSAAALGALLPGPGPAVAVATACRPMGAAAEDGARVLGLKPLGAGAAAAVLERAAGRAGAVSGRAGIRELAAACGGMPLALRCAGGLLAVSPGLDAAGACAALLDGTAGAGGPGSGPVPVLPALLGMTYEALSPDARLAYRTGSLHEGPEFGTGLAAAAAGLPLGQAAAALSELERARLLEWAGQGRYRFHGSVRGHARGLACGDAGERAGAEERIAGWYLEHAGAARRLLSPGGTSVPGQRGPAVFGSAAQARSWLDQERHGLRGTARMAARSGSPGTAWRLADVSGGLAAHGGQPGEQLRAAADGLEAARAGGDRQGQALMHDLAGTAQFRLGRFTAAARSFGRGRALWYRLGDGARLALSALWLGRTAAARGEHTTAILLFERAVARARDAGDSRLAALARTGLGMSLTEAGRTGEAETVLREAVRGLRGGPDRHGLARALAALGRAVPDRPSLAERLLDEALAGMQAAGAVAAQPEILTRLAEAALRAGTPWRARARYEQAAGLLPAGHPDAGAICSALAALPSAGGAR